MSKIDFQRAKTLLHTWRSKLHSFILGKSNLTKEEAFYPEDCAFGKWLYKEGLVKYPNLVKLKMVEKLHSHMHTRVREFMEMKKSGNEFGADRAMAKAEELSEQIIDLLSELENKEADR